MYKRALLLALTLALPQQVFAAKSPLTAGVYVGDPSSGLTVKYRQDAQFSLGLDTLSVTADALWNASDLSQGSLYSPFHLITGVQWVDDESYQLAVRAGLGMEIPFDTFDLYAEGVMAQYFHEDSDSRFEGAIGIRFPL
ncbi:hypothetical protein [Photobacterium atrarenae]|uniref:Outer membrane protein beta-barrel domain-containing protein n=1 Tax=Photobacterium atrarenae TaxID=865757 RepID=A0ABY5GLX7_9GAMM|nr:hypothetical protein [Photobacterium atrarenae]UTV30320.1 hypothetical protein NNL38_17225 [Photobacterium atrarenae]